MKFSNSYIVVDEGEVVRDDIIPSVVGEEIKNIAVLKNAIIDGIVVGSRVELHPGSRVNGGILAEEVIIKGGEVSIARYVKVSKGIVATSRLVVERPEGPCGPLLVVKGDIITRKAWLHKAIVYGNVMGEHVEIGDSVIIGVLGVGEYNKHSGDKSTVHLRSAIWNSIVYSIVANVPIEVYGKLGVISPVLYAEDTQGFLGGGELVLVDPSELRSLVIESVLKDSERCNPLSDLIDIYINEYGLVSLFANGLKGCISFSELEATPLVKSKRRTDLRKALLDLILSE